MKSERRHELQNNELAGFVAQGLEKTRGHWGTILWAAAAVVAVVAAASYWTSQRSGSQAEAWQKYDDALHVDPSLVQNRLKQIAENYPNTDVALWARLDLADYLVFDGKDKLDKDREIGVTRLKEARKAYADVLASPRVLPDMIRRAAIAEAKCFELLGDRENAIDAYRSTAKKYASRLPTVAKDAERLAAELETPEAADFYKWLSEYKPPAPSGAASDFAFPPPSFDDKRGNGTEPGADRTDSGDATEKPATSSLDKDAGDADKANSSEPPATKRPTDDPAAPKAKEPAPASKPDDAPAAKPENSGSEPTPAKTNKDNKPPEPTEAKNE